jgi:hypothetical protein
MAIENAGIGVGYNLSSALAGSSRNGEMRHLQRLQLRWRKAQPGEINWRKRLSIFKRQPAYHVKRKLSRAAALRTRARISRRASRARAPRARASRAPLAHCYAPRCLPLRARIQHRAYRQWRKPGWLSHGIKLGAHQRSVNRTFSRARCASFSRLLALTRYLFLLLPRRTAHGNKRRNGEYSPVMWRGREAA